MIGAIEAKSMILKWQERKRRSFFVGFVMLFILVFPFVTHASPAPAYYGVAERVAYVLRGLAIVLFFIFLFFLIRGIFKKGDPNNVRRPRVVMLGTLLIGSLLFYLIPMTNFYWDAFQLAAQSSILNTDDSVQESKGPYRLGKEQWKDGLSEEEISTVRSIIRQSEFPYMVYRVEIDSGDVYQMLQDDRDENFTPRSFPSTLLYRSTGELFCSYGGSRIGTYSQTGDCDPEWYKEKFLRSKRIEVWKSANYIVAPVRDATQ